MSNPTNVANTSVPNCRHALGITSVLLPSDFRFQINETSSLQITTGGPSSRPEPRPPSFNPLIGTVQVGMIIATTGTTSTLFARLVTGHPWMTFSFVDDDLRPAGERHKLFFPPWSAQLVKAWAVSAGRLHERWHRRSLRRWEAETQQWRIDRLEWECGLAVLGAFDGESMFGDAAAAQKILRLKNVRAKADSGRLNQQLFTQLRDALVAKVSTMDSGIDQHDEGNPSEDKNGSDKWGGEDDGTASTDD
ncbi:MAG: hypothetical protein M1833_003532 [Piccolia ochrophora]|nr:MAG: hypothetical protein M1833_003532 [Piccolia ochrophora]